MKNVKLWLSLILVAVIILGVIFSDRGYSKSEFLMDTVVSVTAYGKNAKCGVEKALIRISEIDKKFNSHNRESEVYKINSRKKTENIDDEVYSLLKKSVEFSAVTDGAFDITLKPVSDLWQIGKEGQKVPQKEEIENALLSVGSYNIECIDENKSVVFKNEKTQLDFGAVAKGYAAEEAIKVLKSCGVENAYLDLGGNIAVMGKRPSGFFEAIKTGKLKRDFVIGIQNPDANRGEIADTVTGDNNYIVTSGAYERNFVKDGVLYHHIMDSKTGYPAKCLVDSVTVVSKDGTAADMISTALFVMGKEGIEKIPEEKYEEIIFIKDGETEHIKSDRKQRD